MVDKSITLSASAIQWQVRLESDKPLQKAVFQLPILVNDGRHTLKVYKTRDNTLNLSWRGHYFQLYAVPAREIDLLPVRSFENVRGAASNCRVVVSPASSDHRTFGWTVTLQHVAENQHTENPLNLPGCGVYIDEVQVALHEKPAKELWMSARAHGKSLEYAWYIYQNGQCIYKKWYAPSNTFSFPIEDPAAEWKVQAFARDPNGSMHSRMQSLQPQHFETARSAWNWD